MYVYIYIYIYLYIYTYNGHYCNFEDEYKSTCIQISVYI